jgi:hypothetical protein
MDTVIPCIQRSSRHRSHQASCCCLVWDKDGIMHVNCLDRVQPSWQSTTLHEAASGLQTLRQAFERNLVS